MLPSQGLFRSIPCPFFLAGLCERPHCSYRHCRSDIRIDRKLESEASESTPEDEGPRVKEVQISLPENGTKQLDENSATAEQPKLIEPVNQNEINSSIKVKLEDTTRVKEEPGEPSRLNKDSGKSSELVRKRSLESKEEDINKKRRLSTEAEDNMGEIYSKIKHVAQSLTAGLFSGTVKREPDDVKEGTSSSSTHKKSHHKKHKHKHKESSSSSTSSKGKDHGGTSHKKENQTGQDHKNKKDERKGKEDKSKGTDKNHDSNNKRRKETSDSASTVSSPQDQKRIRKSSGNDSGDKSKSNNERRHSDKSKRTVSESSVTSQGNDHGNSSRTHGAKSDSGKGALQLVPNGIDLSNRFLPLAELSADEDDDDQAEDVEMSPGFSYAGVDSDEDPDEIEKECFEMFASYKPEVLISPLKDSPKKVEKSKKEDEGEDGFCVVGKKRVAHANAVGSSHGSSAVSTPGPAKKVVTSKSLQDTLAKRFESQSSYKPAEKTNRVQNGSSRPPTATTSASVPAFTSSLSSSMSPPKSSSMSPPKPTGSGKLRIAHVPNAGKLAQKPTITSSMSKNPTPKVGTNIGKTQPARQPVNTTCSQTVAKGAKREAHRPTVTVLSRAGPQVYRDSPNKSSKIPLTTRQFMMDKLYAEYSRIYGSEEAFRMSVDKENEFLGKCTTKQVYSSLVISYISGLRRGNRPDSEAVGPNRVISHQQILSGSLAAKNCSVRTVKKDGVLPRGNRLYLTLRKYLMTEEQLIENGYPRPHPSGEAGRAYARPRQGDDLNMSLTNRICDRCKKRYLTNEDGDHLVSEVCNYHWGRKYSTMSRAGRGARESSYSCCGSDDDKIGCVTGLCHVSKSPVPISSQKGFVSAVNEEGLMATMGEDEWDVIGIDCEMVYTTHGNELARVTIVRADSSVLFDNIVKPSHRVLDCNSRFSGITFDDLEKATWTLQNVQAVLLTKIRPNTIIIGHSLESDLIALRLKHDCVIDTTLLYPHRLGPPKKRALKTLSAEILKKVIQESESGHDSTEDAQIAVELVLAKLKADFCK